MPLISQIESPAHSLQNLDAQFASRIDHPKTLDRLALDLEGAPKYVVRPDLAGLRQVIEATEASHSPLFHAWFWRQCGIGRFCEANPGDALKIEMRECPITKRLEPTPVYGELVHIYAIAARFGITTDEAGSLFGESVPADEATGHDAKLRFTESLEQFIVDHQESSECRACSEIYYVDPEKAAEAMYCPKCEKKHAEQE